MTSMMMSFANHQTGSLLLQMYPDKVVCPSKNGTNNNNNVDDNDNDNE